MSFDINLDFDTSQHDASHEAALDDSGVFLDDVEAKFAETIRSQLPVGG